MHNGNFIYVLSKFKNFLESYSNLPISDAHHDAVAIQASGIFLRENEKELKEFILLDMGYVQITEALKVLLRNLFIVMKEVHLNKFNKPLEYDPKRRIMVALDRIIIGSGFGDIDFSTLFKNAQPRSEKITAHLSLVSNSATEALDAIRSARITATVAPTFVAGASGPAAAGAGVTAVAPIAKKINDSGKKVNDILYIRKFLKLYSRYHPAPAGDPHAIYVEASKIFIDENEKEPTSRFMNEAEITEVLSKLFIIMKEVHLKKFNKPLKYDPNSYIMIVLKNSVSVDIETLFTDVKPRPENITAHASSSAVSKVSMADMAGSGTPAPSVTVVDAAQSRALPPDLVVGPVTSVPIFVDRAPVPAVKELFAVAGAGIIDVAPRAVKKMDGAGKEVERFVNKESFAAAYATGRRDFTDVQFYNADFSDINFNGCDLTGAKFFNVSLGKDSLVGAEIGRATFEFVKFAEWANFNSRDLRDVNFVNCEFKNADFKDANLSFVKFTNDPTLLSDRFLVSRSCNLKSANFTGANFRHTEFLGRPELSGASFHGVKLNENTLHQLYESGIRDFSNAKFNGEKFSLAKTFEGCKFTDADFTGASLHNCYKLFEMNVDIAGIKLENAKISAKVYLALYNAGHRNFSKVTFYCNPPLTAADQLPIYGNCNFENARFIGLERCAFFPVADGSNKFSLQGTMFNADVFRDLYNSGLRDFSGVRFDKDSEFRASDNFAGCNFVGASFAGCDLSQVTSLTVADVESAQWQNVSLLDAVLPSAWSANEWGIFSLLSAAKPASAYYHRFKRSDFCETLCALLQDYVDSPASYAHKEVVNAFLRIKDKIMSGFAAGEISGIDADINLLNEFHQIIRGIGAKKNSSSISFKLELTDELMCRIFYAAKQSGLDESLITSVFAFSLFKLKKGNLTTIFFEPATSKNTDTARSGATKITQSLTDNGGEYIGDNQL